MIPTNRIIETGDSLKESENPEVRTETLLVEISRLYLERCRALREHKEMAIRLFSQQIDSLKLKLAQI